MELEEFNYKAELAEIGKQIAIARQELNDLKESKTAFIKQRDTDGRNAMENAKKGSFEALNAIVANQSELIDFRNKIKYLADEAKQLKNKLLYEIEDYDEKTKTYNQYIADKNKEIKEITFSLKGQLEIIKADKAVLNNREIALNNKAKLLKRKEQTIKSAIKEYGITR